MADDEELLEILDRARLIKDVLRDRSCCFSWPPDLHTFICVLCTNSSILETLASTDYRMVIQEKFCDLAGKASFMDRLEGLVDLTQERPAKRLVTSFQLDVKMLEAGYVKCLSNVARVVLNTIKYLWPEDFRLPVTDCWFLTCDLYGLLGWDPIKVEPPSALSEPLRDDKIDELLAYNNDKARKKDMCIEVWR